MDVLNDKVSVGSWREQMAPSKRVISREVMNDWVGREEATEERRVAWGGHSRGC